MKFLLIGVVLGAISGCGSKIEYRKPSYERPSDGTLTEIRSGNSYTIDQLILKDESKYTMLVFGSEFCLGCIEKNEALKNDLIGKHPIFDVEGFHLYGVNIDYELDFVKEYIDRTGYSFITLWDQEASFLVKNYYGNAADWGVPVTVFLRGNEVVFKYDFTRHQDIKQILDQALETIQK